MALSSTAQRMLETLPSYYWGADLIERVTQARANEIDRLDAIIDQLRVELQPGQASDTFGLLGMWERTFKLPANPPDATVNQRRAKVNAALRKLDSGSAAKALATLQAAMGSSANFTVYRNTPDPLSDTLEIPYAAGSYNAAVIQQIAERLWPAHRRLLMRYAAGFLLDVSRLDEDTL